MASHLVSQHQLSSYATPINGAAGDATVVLGNDNTTVTGYNSHDSDATIHVQDSSAAVFGATPAGTQGRKWMTNDTGAIYFYYDNGSAWVEFNYLRNTGGTVTGNLVVTGTLAVTGAITASSTINGQTISSAASFTGTVATAGKLTVSITGTEAALFTSSAAATAVAIDNTNGATAGSNLTIRKGGTDSGYFGNYSSLAGGVSNDLTVWATASNGIRFVPGGATASATVFSSAGAWTMANGLTVSSGTTAVQALTATSAVITSAGTGLTSNTTAAQANFNAIFKGQRSGATFWWLALDASDQFSLLNAAGNANNLVVTDAGALTVRAGITATTAVFSSGASVASTGFLEFQTRSIIRSSADGLFTLLNNAETGFTRLMFGGTTSSFPSIKRNSAELDVRLADDSAYARVNCGVLSATAGSSTYVFGSGSAILTALVSIGPLNTPIATTSTTPFLVLSVMAGTPTGVVSDGCIVADTSGSKLWVRIGGAWKSANLA